MKLQHFVIRNFRAGANLQSFLVAAVASVLTIRLFLQLTGFPQLGGKGLHIAHLLWGGLFMLAAMMLVFSLISLRAQEAASVLGGIGFGTFIDEVGKFVTSDNNYFFRPAVAIIYVTFILIFLCARAIQSKQSYTESEYLINALQQMEEVVLHDLDEEERERTLRYLDQSNPAHPLVAHLRATLQEMELTEKRNPSLYVRARQWVRDEYDRLTQWRFFPYLVMMFFVGQLMLTLTYVLILIFLLGLEWREMLDLRVIGYFARRVQNLSFVDVAELVSTLFSGIFILWGVICLRRSRLAAFINFERAILVSIFLTQVFTFYREQFSALLGLASNLLILVALRFMIGRERSPQEHP